jgi:solute carrier family 20 (sodium-dependent phosphate transporter)
MYFWLVVVGGAVGFTMAFFSGANDVANSLATSVGSGVLTLRQAILVASIFEFAGAWLLGSHVASTIRNSIVYTANFSDAQLMVGMFSGLTATMSWLMVATWLKLPVSGTHSIVGGIVGFALVAGGIASVQWASLGLIALSWVTSPLAAGLLGFALFAASRRFVLRHPNSLRRALRSLPVWYIITLGSNVFFMSYQGSPALGLDKTPLWAALLATAIVSLLCLPLCWFVVVPLTERWLAIKYGEILGAEHMTFRDTYLVVLMPWLKPSGGRRHVGLDGDEQEERIDHADIATSPLAVEMSMIGSNSSNEESLKDSASTRPSGNDDGNNNNDDDDDEEDELDIDIVADDTPLIDRQQQQQRDKIDEAMTATAIVSSSSSSDDSDDDERQMSMASSSGKRNNSDTDEDEAAIADAERFSEVFEPKTEDTYSFLQVLTACVASFAHGSNDISNILGPYATIVAIGTGGADDGSIPLSVMFVGSIGVVAGLALWGWRVIETVGTGITKVTTSRGFHIQLCSAMTVTTSSRFGAPISTTHAQVGAVIGVGLLDGVSAVNWRLIGGIAVSWVATIPVACVLGASVYFVLAQILSI